MVCEEEAEEVVLVKCTGHGCLSAIHPTCVYVSKKADHDLIAMGKWHCSSCAHCDHCKKTKKVHHPTLLLLWLMLLLLLLIFMIWSLSLSSAGSVWAVYPQLPYQVFMAITE